MATLKYKDPNTNTWKSLSGYIQLGTDVPIGAICEYASDDIPDDYLPCNGQSLLKTDYPELYSKIGDKYGNVDSTHFNLPNIEKRVVVGKSSVAPYDILGNTGGEEKHKLTESEMPSHTHNFNYGERLVAQKGFDYAVPDYANLTGKEITVSSAGEGQAHNNMQPYIVLNYIIKAKSSSYTLSKVIDNLDSNSSTDALSANQGRILNNAILNNSRLVSTYVLQNDSNIFTMSGLDIDRDGGIYDIYMQFQADSENDFAFGVRINGADSTTYNYSGVASNKDGSTFTNVYGKNANAFRLGAKRGNFVGFVKFTITKAAYSLSPRFMISSTSYSSGINSEFINGIFEPGEDINLTSLQFLNTTNNNNFIKTGTKIFVYKK